MNLHNIQILARYESKLLRRSWLFKLFALLSLALITYLQIFTQSNLFFYQWDMITLSSSIPFVNVYIYNIVQSIIAVFLAGDFLKKDRKLDTTEVLYVRPLSNADYIVGKTWGSISVVVGLNLFALCIAAFIHLFASDSPFNLWPYFFYLFTLAIPSLIFILGVSFVLMSIIQNQAVTLVLLLGYIGSTLFYCGNVTHGAFDFFALALPNIFSDITGHPALSSYLIHRISYLIFGIGLIATTIALVKRIPQQPKTKTLLHTLSVIFILIGISFNILYINRYSSNNTTRALYANVYQKYNEQPKAYLLAENIIYSQEKDKLTVTADMTVQNCSQQPITSIIIYLNPNLVISKITSQGEQLSFERDAQVAIIKKNLQPNEICQLTINYEGSIDENICYLDIEDEEYHNTQSENSFLCFGKKYAFVDNDYTLLTPETIWYPTTIPSTNPTSFYDIQKNFTNFSLKVINPQQKIVLSQGESTQQGDTIIFKNEHKLHAISLAIGNYVKKAVMVDSVSFELYHFPGNDYFTQEFTNITDTIAFIIQEAKERFEISKNRIYPFKKFVIAETPISFTGYIRTWKGYSEFVQPEFVFIPEKATTLNANFKIEKERFRNWGQRRNNNETDEQEIEFRTLSNFINRTLLSESGFEESGHQLTNQLTRLFQPSSRGFGEWENKLNKFDLSALYFNFSNFISSSDYPIIDILFNTLQKQEENNNSQRWRRWSTGITNTNEASIFLKGNSFEQASSDHSLSPEVFYEMMKLKGVYLRNYITSQISIEEFNDFINEFTKKYQFTEVSLTTLSDELQQKFNINLMNFLTDWYKGKQIPLFITRDVHANKVVVDNRTKYIVQFKIHNPTSTDGIISIDVEEMQPRGMGGMGGGMWGGNRNQQAERKPLIHYIIPSNSYKEIRLLCENSPRSLSINTNIAQNLPSDMIYNFGRIESTTQDITTGIFDTDSSLFTSNPQDIIVDNENKGFQIIESNQKKVLQSLFKKEDEGKYKALNNWQAPTRWTATISTDFYGDYINSGYSPCQICNP